ncbi:16S rRNA pseudouridine(516) synthase [Piscinibacterium candidicorallinum]|uniref:Pseudouridine synthase n=1 Tax=Piscinibacterium candidicorallinum TaxID=1793872 RepID=A0ABV7GYD6_9BURK
MTLEKILQSQGFGTRRQCAGLILAGYVTVHGDLVEDPRAEFELDGLPFTVDGTEWTARSTLTLVMHKPAGYECSRKAVHHASVFELLPPPIRERGVQPIGRLDADTTGLLLLTDDGQLNHALISPRRHVPKIYEATLKHAADARLCEQLCAGVLLHDENETVVAESARLLGDTLLELTISEGKYHQVKRMVAAAGNRVEALHRVQIGSLRLPADVAPGRWREVTAAELAAARSSPTST